MSVRARADGSPFITDGGNFILDAALGAVSDPAALAACLDGVEGLLAHGFFIDEADALVVGYETGEHRLLLRDNRDNKSVRDDGDNKGVRGNNKGVRDDGDNEGARGRQSVRNVGDNKGVGDDEGARGRQSIREGRGDRNNEGDRVSEVAAGAN